MSERQISGRKGNTEFAPTWVLQSRKRFEVKVYHDTTNDATKIISDLPSEVTDDLIKKLAGGK